MKSRSLRTYKRILDLEPHTTIYKWMFGETTISYIKIWNHPIETTIYKWLFGVPLRYNMTRMAPESLQFPWTKTWDIYNIFYERPRPKWHPTKEPQNTLQQRTSFVARKVETLNGLHALENPAKLQLSLGTCSRYELSPLQNYPKVWVKFQVSQDRGDVFFHNLPSMKLTAKAPENGGPLERRFLLETTIFRVFS